MLNILFLFLFDRAMAVPFGASVAPATCAHIIDAGDRFQRGPSRVGEGQAGKVLPFLPREAFSLGPYLEPVTMTADQFLKDPSMRGRLPGLREYLRVVSAQQPLPATDLVEIRVHANELSSLFSRGTLHYDSYAVRRVSAGRLLRPGLNEIALVFKGRARHLFQSTGEFPIWDLRAIVTGADAHDAAMRALKLRHGHPPYGLVKSIAWAPTEDKHFVDIPLVFEVPLNPYEMFVTTRHWTPEGVSQIDFLRAIEEDVTEDPLTFWLPFARSSFAVESFNGDKIRGRFVEMLADSDELIFMVDDEYRIVALDMIKQIALSEYVPNLPDGVKIEIDPWSQDPTEVVGRYFENSPPPVGTLIITNPGINLEP